MRSRQESSGSTCWVHPTLVPAVREVEGGLRSNSLVCPSRGSSSQSRPSQLTVDSSYTRSIAWLGRGRVRLGSSDIQPGASHHPSTSGAGAPLPGP